MVWHIWPNAIRAAILVKLFCELRDVGLEKLIVAWPKGSSSKKKNDGTYKSYLRPLLVDYHHHLSWPTLGYHI